MSARQHFVNKGSHFDLSAAASFLMLAINAYWPGEPLVPGQREYVDKILARATAAGFGQADIFVTMLANRELSSRTIQIAEDVTAEVGGDAVMLAMIKEFNPKGAAQ